MSQRRMTLMIMAAMARMKVHSIGYESRDVNGKVDPAHGQALPGLRWRCRYCSCELDSSFSSLAFFRSAVAFSASPRCR